MRDRTTITKDQNRRGTSSDHIHLETQYQEGKVEEKLWVEEKLCLVFKPLGGWHTLESILKSNLPLTVDVVAAWINIVTECRHYLALDLERGESYEITKAIDATEDHISRADSEVVEAAKVFNSI